MNHIYKTKFGKVVIQEFTHDDGYIGYIAYLVDKQGEEIDGKGRILRYAHLQNAPYKEAKKQRTYLVNKVIDMVKTKKKSVTFSGVCNVNIVPMKEYMTKAQRCLEWDRFGKYAKESGLIAPMEYKDILEEKRLELIWGQ